MFGTIVCSKKGLTEEEVCRYRSAYCGLCLAIKKRFGQVERLALNYDMTFLAFLLNGLYEECNETREFRCIAHPFKNQNAFENKYIDYAADMTILLAYYKACDDWDDEKKPSGLIASGLLGKDFKRLEEMYPRQAASVKESIQKLRDAEKNEKALPDDAVYWSGKMLSEVFVYADDFWSDALRNFGYELGRFIYLMDAALDYEKDGKSGSYNPLRRAGKKPDEIEELLMQILGKAAVQFEKLPIVQDADIMRNILYSGVWQEYYKKVKGEEEKSGK